jgi:hypothetical protein
MSQKIVLEVSVLLEQLGIDPEAWRAWKDAEGESERLRPAASAGTTDL